MAILKFVETIDKHKVSLKIIKNSLKKVKFFVALSYFELKTI